MKGKYLKSIQSLEKQRELFQITVLSSEEHDQGVEQGLFTQDESAVELYDYGDQTQVPKAEGVMDSTFPFKRIEKVQDPAYDKVPIEHSDEQEPVVVREPNGRHMLDTGWEGAMYEAFLNNPDTPDDYEMTGKERQILKGKAWSRYCHELSYDVHPSDNATKITPMYVSDAVSETVWDAAKGLSPNYALKKIALPSPATYIWFENPWELGAWHLDAEEVGTTKAFDYEKIIDELYDSEEDKYIPTHHEQIRGILLIHHDSVYGQDFIDFIHDHEKEGNEAVRPWIDAHSDFPEGAMVYLLTECPYEDTIYGRGGEKLPVEHLRYQMAWAYGISVGNMETLQAPEGKRQPLNTLEIMKAIAALLEFLQQRVAISTRETLSKKQSSTKKGKKLQKNSPDGESLGVQVVKLRRTEQRVYEASKGGGRTWTKQWVVSGHWRNQPTNQGYIDKWIAPYIKGPDHLPLTGADKLFAVER